jgi:hypothetical protein
MQRHLPLYPPLPPDLRGPGDAPIITRDRAFNMGASISNLRSLRPSPAAFLRANVGEALIDAALRVMPEGTTSDEAGVALVGALWREDGMAVAVSLRQANAPGTFVFVRQADGSYAGTDASRIVADGVFGLLGRPADDYEYYATRPLSWEMTEDGQSLLQVELLAVRDGLLYTSGGQYLVSPDGSIANP